VVQVRAFFILLFESENILYLSLPIRVGLLSLNRFSCEEIFLFAEFLSPKLDFSAFNFNLSPANDIKVFSEICGIFFDPVLQPWGI